MSRRALGLATGAGCVVIAVVAAVAFYLFSPASRSPEEQLLAAAEALRQRSTATPYATPSPEPARPPTEPRAPIGKLTPTPMRTPTPTRTPRPPTPTPRPTPIPAPVLTVTPRPYELAGEARPDARFLVQRGEEAWLIDLAAGTETELPVSGKWGFAQNGPGDDLYFVEFVSKVEQTYTSRLVRVNAAGRTELFTWDSAGWWLGWAAAVSPDRSAVAYLSADGVRMHILASSQDVQIVSNERSGCPGSRNCYGYYRVQWPVDGQHIIATRIEYEPSGTYAFEARFGAQDGVRLATVPGAGFGESDNLVVGGKYCTDSAANFGSPFEIAVFDLLAQTGRKVGRPDSMRADACVMNATGEVAVQWEPDFAAKSPPRDSAAVFYDSKLEAGLAVAVPSTARLYDWLPDRSGLVFRTTDIDPRFERTEPIKYLLLDRDGKWWGLPMIADDLLAVLP